MSWRERMQPASFRGVPFYVEDESGNIGRRKQVHEYPKRDEPYVEDMGRKTRDYTFSAFVIGPDYMDDRDRLLGALEQVGSGQLVHPYYGRMSVDITDCNISHSRANGGMCEIRISFVESGSLSFPNAADRTEAAASMAADSLATASLDNFSDTFSVNGFPQFVSDDALTRVNKAVQVATKTMRYAQPGVAEETFTPESVLSSPELLGAGLVGVFVTASQLVEKADELTSDKDKADFYRKHANAAMDVQATLPHDSNSGDTASRRQIINNANAVNGVVRRQALCNAVGASALMPAAVQDDVNALRKRIAAAIDNEITGAPDDVLEALLDLRNRAWRDLTDRSRGSARLTSVSPLVPVPAVVLAYDLYEDAERADEIVARNRIANPAFVSGDIQVLSR